MKTRQQRPSPKFGTKFAPVSKQLFSTGITATAVLASAMLWNTGAHAATYTWNTNSSGSPVDGGGAWNATGGTNWLNGSTYGAFGNTTSDTAVFGVANGAAGTITVGSVTANAITFNNAGSGNYTLSSGTITLGGSAPTITVNASGTSTIASLIAGSSGLTKAGAGTLLLSSSNSYTGGTILSAGTLTGGASGAFGTGTVTMSANTTLNYSAGVSDTIAGGFVFNGDGNRTIATGSAAVLTVNGALQGSSLTNASTIILGGSNATTQFNGNLQLGSANVYFFGDGASGSGSTFNIVSGGTVSAGNVTYNYQRNAGSYLVFQNGAQATVSNLTASSDWAKLRVNNSAVTVSGTWTVGGNVTGEGILEPGGWLGCAQATCVSSESSFNSEGIIFKGGTLAALGSSTNWLTSNVNVLSSATTGYIDTGAYTVTANARFIGGGNQIVKVGAGTLVLSGTGNSYYSGGFAISSGTLQFTVPTALGTGTTSFTGNGAVLQAATSGTVSTNIGMAANGSFDLGSNTIVLTGLVSGSGNLTQTGAGALTLSGSNSYSGGTTLSTGTLMLGNAHALGSGGLTVNGGTLDLAGNSVSVAAFGGAGGAVTNSGSGTSTLTTALASGTSTYAGNIANGTGAVVVTNSGSGTLILGGSLTMAGLNANAGTVQLAQSGSIAAVNVASGATVALAAHSGSTRNVLSISSLTISGFTSTLATANDSSTNNATYMSAATRGQSSKAGVLTDTGRALAQASDASPASPEAVPEPGVFGMLLAGALGLFGIRRKGGRSSRA